MVYDDSIYITADDVLRIYDDAVTSFDPEYSSSPWSAFLLDDPLFYLMSAESVRRIDISDPLLVAFKQAFDAVVTVDIETSCAWEEGVEAAFDNLRRARHEPVGTDDIPCTICREYEDADEEAERLAEEAQSEPRDYPRGDRLAMD